MKNSKLRYGPMVRNDSGKMRLNSNSVPSSVPTMPDDAEVSPGAGNKPFKDIRAGRKFIWKSKAGRKWKLRDDKPVRDKDHPFYPSEEAYRVAEERAENKELRKKARLEKGRENYGGKR